MHDCSTQNSRTKCRINTPADIQKCWHIYLMSAGVTDKRFEAARRVFRRGGGTLRTNEAIEKGIHPRILYAMRDAGLLERLDRGLYRLADLPPLSDPDLFVVANRVPDGVICLVSALHFHGITTRLPRVVSIAVRRGTQPRRIEYPPTQFHWFSGEAFSAGVETHLVDETPVQIYSAEKTLADCFKYRNKIGMDAVLEALYLYRDQHKPKVTKLIEHARTCRVEKVMRPYLETVLYPHT